MAFQPTHLGAPSLPAVYCNGVQIAVSPWDVTFIFIHAVPGTLQQSGPIDESQVEKRLVQAVVMSPQHAKALAQILDINVRTWEDLNGEINLAPTVVEEIERLRTGGGEPPTGGAPAEPPHEGPTS